MSKWEGTKLVRGLKVSPQPGESVSWLTGHQFPWRYWFWGGRLCRGTTLITQGCKTVRDAVLYSIAYDQGRADLDAEDLAKPKAERRRQDFNPSILPMNRRSDSDR